MKKKLLPLMLVVAGSIVLLAGCSKKEEALNQSAYEKIQTALIGMESYQSEATVKYITNKGSNEYGTLQQCRITGEYRVEVTAPDKAAGNVTIFDGQTIAQFNHNIAGKIAVGTTESPERSEIFITSFVKNYVNSQEVSVSAANLDEGQCTVLEAVVPGNHPYLSREKLWVDNETAHPVRLVIYDPDGAERIVVDYTNFAYNVELEDAIFKVQ